LWGMLQGWLQTVAPQGIGAILLRTQNRQVSLCEAFMPDDLRGLRGELALVDELLDDPSFWEPFRPHFDPVWGRPSVPIETFLRMMFLKYRYELGYERLCVEVTDSISWQIFCRIPVGSGDVPSPSTLAKITKRVGAGVISEVNDALLLRAAGRGLVDLGRVRADTTVVEANVAYPTDAGLLAKGVRRIGKLVGKVKGCGGASRTPFRDRTRAAGRRVRAIGVNLKRRSDESREAVRRLNGEVAGIAAQTIADAQAVLRNARRHLARRPGDGRLRRYVADLEAVIAATVRVISQTRQRLAGTTPEGSTRIVSLHDVDARPIVKGRLGKPVEFGYKAQICDNKDGIVLDYSVVVGNPSDGPLLGPAIERIKALFGRAPSKVTADRGYNDPNVEGDLHAAGVDKVAIPKAGKTSEARREYEGAGWFRRLIIWRTGCEARISRLKNGYGMNRTFIDGTDGCATWCGWAILAHNAVGIARLTDPTVTIRHRRSRRNRDRPPEPTGHGPPPTQSTPPP